MSERYSDADWVGFSTERGSITDYCTYVCGKYRAMAHSNCELKSFKNLLQELGFLIDKPKVMMHCDNQATIHNYILLIILCSMRGQIYWSWLSLHQKSYGEQEAYNSLCQIKRSG